MLQAIAKIDPKISVNMHIPYEDHHPLKNLTVDALALLERWRIQSIDQLDHEVKVFPKLLGLTDKAVSLNEPNYPEALKKLSVYSLGCSSHRANVKNKVDVLHRVGLCHVGDLIIISDMYRPIIKNKKIRKLFSKLGSK